MLLISTRLLIIVILYLSICSVFFIYFRWSCTFNYSKEFRVKYKRKWRGNFLYHHVSGLIKLFRQNHDYITSTYLPDFNQTYEWNKNDWNVWSFNIWCLVYCEIRRWLAFKIYPIFFNETPIYFEKLIFFII